MVIIQLDSEQLSSVIQAAVKKAIADQEKIARPTTEVQEFLNVEETSNFLDLTPRTVRKKASKGEIPSSKRAGRLYFSRQQLTEWLKEGGRKTNAEISAEAEKHIQGTRRRRRNARV